MLMPMPASHEISGSTLWAASDCLHARPNHRRDQRREQKARRRRAASPAPLNARRTCRPNHWGQLSSALTPEMPDAVERVVDLHEDRDRGDHQRDEADCSAGRALPSPRRACLLAGEIGAKSARR